MKKVNNFRELTIIAGKSTFGKSYYADEYLYLFNRVVIVDPKVEHDGKYIYSIERLAEHIDENPLFRVSTNNLTEFEHLCRVLKKKFDRTRRVMLCIEEITRLDLDPRLSRFPEFKEIVYAGGHCGVDLCIVAQRISTVPIACRSQYQKIYTFNQTDPDDIDYLKSVASDVEVLNVNKLGRREYLFIDDAGNVTKGKS